MAPNGRLGTGPRCFAIVGPFQSGKTTLLEAIVERTGAISRAGRVSNGDSVGDASAEARAHAMSIEPNVATVEFLGESMTFVDCPGSTEFLHEMRNVTPVCDAAIVVCEADERKIPALEIILRELEEADIPRFLFINKIDTATQRIRETLALLQQASRTPLLLRQIPLWKDGIAVGFIDLALERAFIYREHAPSEIVDLPEGELPREKEARFAMLERLADYDDELMEELISEIEPPRDQIFDDLSKELRDRHVVPALIGSAERGNGITRLLKALRHEAPTLAETRARLGLPEEGAPLAQAMKTLHMGQGGKLTIARVLRGTLHEGDTVVGSRGAEARIGSLSTLLGTALNRKVDAVAGDTVGFGRLEGIATGDAFAAGKARPEAIVSSAPPESVYVLALKVKDRKDDVRLSSALSKITEEDPSLVVETRPEMGEIRLHGQGEMHLRVAVEKLASRFQVGVETSKPRVAYCETIKLPAAARGRHRKQTGGHGQFGDVMIEIRPLPRGEGFAFQDQITGGVVPRQYIPSVETGVRDALKCGPLGFPVVDLAVTLTDGSYHTVDSSDAAFQAAAKLALAEALPKAKPVLLEPVLSVEVTIPTDALSKATALVTGRRGQIQGYDERPGWTGWQVLSATIPESEVGDLIVELRSATAGVGTFSTRFDHMAELSGRPADMVLQKAH
ncbi:elongation factor G [Microvirga lotononidis]|uniref:Elongation factor G n=1 Tax=Microvirga lotononidis TaxID=864069 RepID=I4YPM6_9HYPH|nr:elongation factor G [Microvirga lotononidis]EIM25918.1 translation elongation factor-like GTPase [Microvirga lotononidis]WQO25833.1 elongation factor G [Microvirga lotononidis]